MRRDWDAILMLLNISEKLAGHPTLKELRDEAAKDLNEIVAQPPNDYYHPEHMTEETQPQTDTDGPAWPPTESYVEPTEPVVRRKL